MAGTRAALAAVRCPAVLGRQADHDQAEGIPARGSFRRGRFPRRPFALPVADVPPVALRTVTGSAGEKRGAQRDPRVEHMLRARQTQPPRPAGDAFLEAAVPDRTGCQCPPGPVHCRARVAPWARAAFGGLMGSAGTTKKDQVRGVWFSGRVGVSARPLAITAAHLAAGGASRPFARPPPVSLHAGFGWAAVLSDFSFSAAWSIDLRAQAGGDPGPCGGFKGPENPLVDSPHQTRPGGIFALD